MRRYKGFAVPAAVAAVLVCGSCKERKPQKPAPRNAVSHSEFLRKQLRQRRTEYEEFARRSPGNLSALWRNAWTFLSYARKLGDSQQIEYFKGELARIDKEFRAKALTLVRQAQREAEQKAATLPEPEDVWYERESVWNRCGEELARLRQSYVNGKVIDDLMREAEKRRAEAYQLHRAFMRLAEAERTARADIEDREAPEDAVARIGVLRAYLRAEGLLSPEGGAAAGQDRSEDFLAAARTLVERLETLTQQFEAKLPALAEAGTGSAAAPLADIPWEEVKPGDFPVYFAWSSEDGTCEAAGGKVVLSGGSKGGVVEAEGWNEFVFELEVFLVEGSRFWLGARPAVSSASGRPEYRQKCAVKVGPGSWHRLRVQVVGDQLAAFELSAGKPKVLGEIPALVPSESKTVRPGFMIGLEAHTKLQLRALRFKTQRGDGRSPKEGAVNGRKGTSPASGGAKRAGSGT